MTDKAFAESIKQKLSKLGEVTTRPMMGEYCVYLNGKLIGSICDNRLFLKKFAHNKDFLEDCSQNSPYPGAKPMYMPNIDDEEFLQTAAYYTFLGASAGKGGTMR